MVVNLEKYNILKKTKTKLGNEVSLIGDENIPPNSDISLIIGVFHGDEPQGKFLIEEYLKYQMALSSASQPTNFPLSPPLSLKGRGCNRKYQTFAIKNAKNLRHDMTNAETILWNFLRAKKFNGYKFRRQQPIGKYIVDFVCMNAKLIIEIDGGQHNFDENILADQKRTNFLKNCGYKVIRIWNNDIFENIDGVLEYIENTLAPRGRGLGRGGNPTNSLLFIPCLNPDGMQLGQRTNANGVDLNRNFPTKNWGENHGDNATCDDAETAYYGGTSGGSEIETQFLIDTISEFKPNKILTLHAPYKVVNYDGPAKELAEKISTIINYPVEASIGYPTPGSFGTYAGVERQIPTITLELDEEIPVEQLIQPVFEIFDEVL